MQCPARPWRNLLLELRYTCSGSPEIKKYIYIVLALLTPFGIHNFYAKRIEIAFINLFIDILMIVLGVFAGDAADKAFMAPEYKRIHYNNRCDTLVLLILICAIISVVWRITECCIVKHDGNGVKMK